MLDILPLDLDDATALVAFDGVYQKASSAGRAYATPWPLPERLAVWRAHPVISQFEGWLAVEDGEVVGVAEIELPLLDNTHLGDVSVYVAPRRVRHGIGSALADNALSRLSADGRRVVQSFVAGAQLFRDRDRSGARTSGESFAAAYGLTNRLMDVHRVLELPVPDDQLRALAEQAAERHGGYRRVAWRDRCPSEHVAAYCRLKEAMVAEAPMGDLDVEPEVWDEARLRETETELAAMGRTRYVQAAIAPDGSMAGHSELVVPKHDPQRVFQWDTLVLPSHRGRRLGLGLKVANHVLLQDEHPERTQVHTWNAADNPAMTAVNDVLGFRPVELMGEWQGPVPA